MVVYFIITLAAYFSASFLLTAAIVRLFGKSSLAKAVRKKIYLFPIVPVWASGFLAFQAISLLRRTSRAALHRTFETLSGKKTYRRKRIRLYQI